MVEGLTCDAENLTLFIAIRYPTLQLIFVESSLGDRSGGGTPGPIPNPEVKPASADGTWLVTARESRSLPRGFSFNPQWGSVAEPHFFLPI
jgi:hypothetical protein